MLLVDSDDKETSCSTIDTNAISVLNSQTIYCDNTTGALPNNTRIRVKSERTDGVSAPDIQLKSGHVRFTASNSPPPARMFMPILPDEFSGKLTVPQLF